MAAVYPRPAFHPTSRAGVNVGAGADISPKIRIGDRSSLGTRCVIQSDVIIGDDVMMGPDVKIFSKNHAFDAIDIPMKIKGSKSIRPLSATTSGSGANVIILPGKKIGNHAVLAAGWVITKDVPGYGGGGGWGESSQAQEIKCPALTN